MGVPLLSFHAGVEMEEQDVAGLCGGDGTGDCFVLSITLCNVVNHNRHTLYKYQKKLADEFSKWIKLYLYSDDNNIHSGLQLQTGLLVGNNLLLAIATVENQSR